MTNLHACTMGDRELLSPYAVQARNASFGKRKKNTYSVVHYLSNKHTANAGSQIEAETQLVSKQELFQPLTNMSSCKW